ncbi:solute carrier family 26 protein [Balneolales bacterium ANBcel1]|nr:solute carrier family 26 protein [Balneolales bacterium ANBcel1]
MKRYLPILSWLPEYHSGMLKGDLAAGLTVGVMLIPQAMAYALIAGLPPVYGLYAALVPLFIYGVMGTSRQLGVGPVAVVALLVAAGVADLAEPGSNEYIQLAILLAFMVGVIQIGMGLFRMGFLVNFLSHPVITGFVAATALIIAFSQAHNILGIPIESSKHIHQTIFDIIRMRSDIHPGTAALGLGAIAVLMGLKRWNRRLPAALVVVAAGIGIIALTGWDRAGIGIIGEVPTGLPGFGIPEIGMDAVYSLLPMAVAISLVGFMESIAVARSIQARHRDYKLDANQELVALGSANLGGSFFQAFPVTGGFSRSAVNDQAGAKSGMASIISALLVGLTLLFLTPLFYYLPNAVLGAIIVTAVLGLIDTGEMRFLWKARKDDFAMMAVTFLVTLFVGIEQGILTGVVASLGVVIYHSSKPHVARLGQLPGTRLYRNLARFSDARDRDDILVIRFDAPLFYANADFFKETVIRFAAAKKPDLRLLVLDASGINSIDTTGVHMLMELKEELDSEGVSLRFAAVHGPVRDMLTRCDFGSESPENGEDPLEMKRLEPKSATGDGTVSNPFTHLEIQDAIDSFFKEEGQRV